MTVARPFQNRCPYWWWLLLSERLPKLRCILLSCNRSFDLDVPTLDAAEHTLQRSHCSGAWTTSLITCMKWAEPFDDPFPSCSSTARWPSSCLYIFVDVFFKSSSIYLFCIVKRKPHWRMSFVSFTTSRGSWAWHSVTATNLNRWDGGIGPS